tara:strand:+ start:17005 stop:17217 length:213 start_codon:yes stop_codon:yes gene_type:complete
MDKPKKDVTIPELGRSVVRLTKTSSILALNLAGKTARALNNALGFVAEHTVDGYKEKRPAKSKLKDIDNA